MKLECKLIKKTFKDKDNETHEYYVLSFNLGQDETLDITIKGDKARLLLLSSKLNNQLPDLSFFTEEEASSLNN